MEELPPGIRHKHVQLVVFLGIVHVLFALKPQDTAERRVAQRIHHAVVQVRAGLASERLVRVLAARDERLAAGPDLHFAPAERGMDDADGHAELLVKLFGSEIRHGGIFRRRGLAGELPRPDERVDRGRHLFLPDRRHADGVRLKRGRFRDLLVVRDRMLVGARSERLLHVGLTGRKEHFADQDVFARERFAAAGHGHGVRTVAELPHVHGRQPRAVLRRGRLRRRRLREPALAADADLHFGKGRCFTPDMRGGRPLQDGVIAEQVAHLKPFRNAVPGGRFGFADAGRDGNERKHAQDKNGKESGRFHGDHLNLNSKEKFMREKGGVPFRGKQTSPPGSTGQPGQGRTSTACAVSGTDRNSAFTNVL